MKLDLSLFLRYAPRPLKAVALGYLLSLGLAYAYGLLHLSMSIGYTPNEIAVHYRGFVANETSNLPGEEEFSFDDMSDSVLGQPGVSVGSLISEGHFHLFGMSTFF
jgi:hypothetical protein